MVRMTDGSSGDADHGAIARTHTDFRKPEPRIAGQVQDAPGEARTRFLEGLSRDLEDGTWDARHGRLRELPEWEGWLVLLVSTP